MAEFGRTNNTDRNGGQKFIGKGNGLKGPEPFNVKHRKKRTRKNLEEMRMRRTKVDKALRPYLGKIVNLTLRTEVGKYKKGWFFVSRLEIENVFLIEARDNNDNPQEIQKEKEIPVLKEKIYCIFDGKKRIWPQRGSLPVSET
jgi:hypothetical protein